MLARRIPGRTVYEHCLLRAGGLYDRGMAYDEELADRIRALLAGEPDVTEKRMFGGLAFLVRGNMAVTASGRGGVMVRVDPAKLETLLATTNAQQVEMGGREMRGWLRVGADDVRTKRQLARWVSLGIAMARSLPAKQPRSRARRTVS